MLGNEGARKAIIGCSRVVLSKDCFRQCLRLTIFLIRKWSGENQPAASAEPWCINLG